MMLSHTLSQLGKSQMFAIIHKLTRHQRLHSTPNGCREILRIVSQFWYLITNLFKTSQNLTKSFSDFYYLLLWRFLLTECAQRFWVGNVSGFFCFSWSVAENVSICTHLRQNDYANVLLKIGWNKCSLFWLVVDMEMCSVNCFRLDGGTWPKSGMMRRVRNQNIFFDRMQTNIWLRDHAADWVFVCALRMSVCVQVLGIHAVWRGIAQAVRKPLANKRNN